MLGKADPFRDSGMSAFVSTSVFWIEYHRPTKWTHQYHGWRHQSRVFVISTTTGRLINSVNHGWRHPCVSWEPEEFLRLDLDRGDQAKRCFMEALALGVKCYDPSIWSGSLYTGKLGTSIYLSDASRCSSRPAHCLYRPSYEIQTCTRLRLGDPDVLFSFADPLYLQITEFLVLFPAVTFETGMPMHIECMFHLSRLHSRHFNLTHEHEMVDR